MDGDRGEACDCNADAVRNSGRAHTELDVLALRLRVRKWTLLYRSICVHYDYSDRLIDRTLQY